MNLWETVWERLRQERPELPTQPRSWGGFLGAAFAGLIVLIIWFPVRLIHEIIKALPLTQKPDHRTESEILLREALELSAELPSPTAFAESVLKFVELPPALQQFFGPAICDLYSSNMMLNVPPMPRELESLEGIRWRDRLRNATARMTNSNLVAMRKACVESVDAVFAQLPKITGHGDVTAPISSLTQMPGRLVEALIKPFSPSLFPNFAQTYKANVEKISGVTGGKSQKPQKLVEPHHLDDPTPFLEGTPFANFLTTPLPITIPEQLRMSHHWIVAGTGAGKTNALQYLIAQDLEKAIRGECSIVVLDSQHQLIERLSRLKLFAPSEPLDGKLGLLDAADIEYPIAVNLFDMKLDRVAKFSPLEREKILNSTLEMYDFIIGSLLQSEMTSRQSTLFRFVTRAMLAIPGATIHTFHDILQNGISKYENAIQSLDPTARHFFATDFNSAQFKQTKEQVVARLWAVLGNTTFLRMFSAPQSKVDFFAEINTPGKVILINAEKGLLKEEGTELFGRFFLALINQAAAQRSSLPVASRLPCFVYVDECHNYIKNDAKIQVILAEARQQNIGVILAHQYLAQLDPPVLRALSANTSIKMAARIDAGDRAVMARDMNTIPDFIRDQRVGSFATYMRDQTASAISLHFPFNPLKNYPSMSNADWITVRDRNRSTYASSLSSGDGGPKSSERNQDEPKGPRSRRDPDKP